MIASIFFMRRLLPPPVAWPIHHVARRATTGAAAGGAGGMAIPGHPHISRADCTRRGLAMNEDPVSGAGNAAGAITAARMRAIEAAAIASGTVTGAALMERAGAGAVAAMLDHWPALAAGRHRAVVLCGPGNNGGDGYVMARHLVARGWDVRVLTADYADLVAGRLRPGDAGAAARACVEAGGRPEPLTAEAVAAAADGAAILVDALLGIGQNRPADALLAPVHAGLDRLAAAPPVVAVDVPTGLDTDTGAPLAARPLWPDLCVTFHAEKPVHAVLRARGVPVVVVDIGLAAPSI
jgi:hydroxyethylthiazole kinase-like uncharacterized protein yjeF